MDQDFQNSGEVERGQPRPDNAVDKGDHIGGKVTFRHRLEHFTWLWFACTMSTGALTVVLASTPHRFPGLDQISKIFFITDLVLFVAFTILIITRFVLVPHKLFSSLRNPSEGLFFGTYWVSVSLILNCTQLLAVSSCGPWLVKALEILFWIYCAIVLLVAVFQYYIFFQDARLQVNDAVPAWIFPIYPLLVVGSMAGNIIKSQPEHAAYPMWVGAVMLQGLAWIVSLMMYSIYTQRLMTCKLPSPPTRPGMFVSVGPAGYTTAGLISLGSLAPKIVPAHAFNIKTIPAGEFAEVIGIISGTFVILFAVWFCCISSIAVIMGIRRMTFTLNWWALIFPNAGLTLGAIQLGKAYSSPGINGVCSALTIILVIFWLFTAVAHIKAVWEGTILWPGKDEDSSTSPSEKHRAHSD